MRKPPSTFADGGEALVQKIAKFLAAAGVAQLAQGLGLNLADAFTRDVEFLSDFLKGAGPPVYDAESKLQHFFLTRSEGVEHLFQLLAQQGEGIHRWGSRG